MCVAIRYREMVAEEFATEELSTEELATEGLRVSEVGGGIPSIEWEKRYTRSFSSWLRGVWPVISTVGLCVYLGTIAAVSIYDMALTIKYPLSLKELELNPVGRWLMSLDRLPSGRIPDLGLFLGAKFLGTVTVMGVLFWLVGRSGRIGHSVGMGVAACQIALAIYLHYGEI